MRPFSTRGWACDRAREAVSLRLDSELSQLEEVLLERHLGRCTACAAFAADTTAITGQLRHAPLVALEHPIELPRRRRMDYILRGTGAWAAAAAVAVTALGAVLTLPAQREAAPTTSGYMARNQDLRDLRILRTAQMKPLALILSRPLRGPQVDA